jgi:hypothetical protein
MTISPKLLDLMQLLDHSIEEMKKENIINHPAQYLKHCEIVNNGEKQLLLEYKRLLKKHHKIVEDINHIQGFLEFRNIGRGV